MREWVDIRLADIAKPGRENFVDGDWIEAPYIADEGVRLIQTGNIGVGKFIDKNKKYISEESFKELRCKPVNEGDVLICRLAEPAGRSCIAPKTDAEKNITSVDVTIFRVDEERFNKSFVVHSINTQEFLDRCQEVAGGTTRTRISRSNLGNLILKCPPLKQQKKIAHILTTVDNLIEKTQALIDKYTAVKQGMMHDLFTRGIDLATGQLRPTYEQAPELYKETELGWVPREWGIVRLDELGEIVTGNTPSTNNLDLYGDEYMFVSPADIGGDSVFIFSTEKNLSDLGMRASRVIPAGSICTVCIGSTIGKMAVTTSVCTTNQQINTLIPNTKQFGSLYYYLMRHYLLPQLKVEAGLQAVPIVNKSRFSGLQIPIPNLDGECKLISKKLAGVDKAITAEVDVLGKMHLHKKGLMRDLLTGRVLVNG